VIYLDTGYTIIITNRDWIKKIHPDLKIHYIKKLINVRGVNTVKCLSNEYIIFNFFILRLINGEIQLLKITAEVYLITNL